MSYWPASGTSVVEVFGRDLNTVIPRMFQAINSKGSIPTNQWPLMKRYIDVTAKAIKPIVCENPPTKHTIPIKIYPCVKQNIDTPTITTIRRRSILIALYYLSISVPFYRLPVLNQRKNQNFNQISGEKQSV